MIELPLPQFWTQAKLGEVTTMVGGGTPSRNVPEFFSGDILWATPTDITGLDSLWIEDTAEKITEIGLESSSAKLLPAGTVLMTSRATIGVTAIAKYPIATNQGFINFICNPEFILNEYLAFWLPAIKDWLIQIAGGTTFKEITRSTARNIEIPLPPLPEQERIVAILRQADELRRLRQQARTVADQLLPALFHSMIGSPASWEKTIPLGECVDFVGGGTPSRQIGEYFSGDIPWATSKDIKSRYLDDAQEHITQEAIAHSATKLVPEGTILLVVKSKILMHSLPLGITMRPFCFGQDVKGLVCKPSRQPQFIASAVLAQTNYILDQARGVNTEGLTLEILRRIPIPDVDTDLQTKFVNQVTAFDGIEYHSEISEKSLRELFDSVTGQAFSGELTAVYRQQHQTELQEAAAQRDIALGLRGRKARVIDFEQGYVTPEEEERFRQQISEMMVPVAQEMSESLRIAGEVITKWRFQYQSSLAKLVETIQPALLNHSNLVNNALTESVASLNRTTQTMLAAAHNSAIAVQSLSEVVQSVSEAAQRSQALYQSLAQNIIALADIQVRQAAQMEPLQPDRTIHAVVDPVLGVVLRAVRALSTYFTAAELHRLLQSYSHYFPAHRPTDLVQAETALHLLAALGFVRQVVLDGRLVYRLIDPIADGALLPEEIS